MAVSLASVRLYYPMTKVKATQSFLIIGLRAPILSRVLVPKAEAILLLLMLLKMMSTLARIKSIFMRVNPLLKPATSA